MEFVTEAWEEYQYWIETDSSVIAKINRLLITIKQDPFKGEGKPEPLKRNYQGYWSRRITGEHRLVYAVSGTRGLD